VLSRNPKPKTPRTSPPADNAAGVGEAGCPKCPIGGSIYPHSFSSNLGCPKCPIAQFEKKIEKNFGKKFWKKNFRNFWTKNMPTIFFPFFPTTRIFQNKTRFNKIKFTFNKTKHTLIDFNYSHFSTHFNLSFQNKTYFNPLQPISIHFAHLSHPIYLRKKQTLRGLVIIRSSSWFIFEPFQVQLL